MKDGLIFKLTITEIGHRFTQFKKITDVLPVLCADTNFQGLDEVLQTGRDLVETDSYRLIQTPPSGLPLTMCKLALSTQQTHKQPMACVPPVLK